MTYLPFELQVAQHVAFLRAAGLDVSVLAINTDDFILAYGIKGPGRFAYKTVSRRLNHGMTGLLTWCRSEKGQISTFKSYGYPPEDGYISGSHFAFHSKPHDITNRAPAQGDIERIQKFWELSLRHGTSVYLDRKRVGGYGIRFRENQYGKIAVIPLRNIYGELHSYQILNPNGSKVFAKGVSIRGLFHALNMLEDGFPIGIAEGYATAATCFELLELPMVAVFAAENLRHVAMLLREHYPSSALLIFADNDQHLPQNKGLQCALSALGIVQKDVMVLAPQFASRAKTKDRTDWNDLVCEFGAVSVQQQMLESLNQVDTAQAKNCLTVRPRKLVAI